LIIFVVSLFVIVCVIMPVVCLNVVFRPALCAYGGGATTCCENECKCGKKQN
jgi:hypothetical protein